MSKKAPVIAASAFEKIKTPKTLLNSLQDHSKLSAYKPTDIPTKWDPEWLVFQKLGVYSYEKKDQEWYINPMPPSLEDLGYELLTPFVREWANCEVIRSWAYGIRGYSNSCRLSMHRDRPDTHVLSAIVHVEDISNKPWPLDFIDHSGKHHEVYMGAGETLLYESFCPHGRVQPFDGLYYRNCYFHWRPKDWDPSIMDGIPIRYPSLERALKDVI